MVKQGPMVPTLDGGWMQHCTAGRGRLGGDDCSECSDYRGGCLRWNTMVTMVTEEPITAPSWLVTPYQGLSYPTNSTFALLQDALQGFQTLQVDHGTSHQHRLGTPHNTKSSVFLTLFKRLLTRGSTRHFLVQII